MLANEKGIIAVTGRAHCQCRVAFLPITHTIRMIYILKIILTVTFQFIDIGNHFHVLGLSYLRQWCLLPTVVWG